MIVLHRKIPRIIPKLEALLGRLPPTHPKIPDIEQELAKYVAGYKGEKSLDYYFSFLPEQDFLILHGLRLPFKESFFQVDTLFLSKYFFLCLESKSHSGTLMFDDTFKQMIQIKSDGVKKVYKDPVQQVRLQQFQLSEWLKSNKIPVIPMEHIVAITNLNTILQTTNPNSDYVKKVITSPRFIEKMNELKCVHKMIRSTDKELRKISRLLIKHHTPADPDVLKNFQIDPSELLTGVMCEKCSRTPMVRKSRAWICPQCNLSSKTAHIDALKDYSLLLSPTISNGQATKFLNLPTRHMTYKVLKTLKFPQTGTIKDKKYILDFKDYD